MNKSAEPPTIADLPFAEQTADLEYEEAAGSILRRLGKSAESLPALDDSARHWVAVASIARLTRDEDTLRRIAAEFDGGAWEHNECQVLSLVIRNPAVPADVVSRLARHRSRTVNELAAAHRLLPSAEIERLARDGSTGQKLGIAVNPVTPPQIRALLAAGRDEVRARVSCWESGEWQRHNPE